MSTKVLTIPIDTVDRPKGSVTRRARENFILPILNERKGGWRRKKKEGNGRGCVYLKIWLPTAMVPG